MELKYKDDFQQAKKYWDAFWEGEVIDRPLIISTIPKSENNKSAILYYYLSGIDGNFEEVIEKFQQCCENTIFFAECIPNLNISFGPDTIAYFIKGTGKNVIIGNETAWIEPFVENWEDFGKIEIDKEDQWYKKFMNFYQYASKQGEGKFLIQMPDFHTHLDLLRAIRGSENLCIDLIESPDLIKKHLEELKDIFVDIYLEIYNNTNMKKWGTTCWIPLYSEKKYCTIQCDFICMIGPEMFRKFALSYIEYEVNFLDHSIFHLDGPGALKHLNALLSIKKLDAIQWVPGAGQKPHIYWIEILKRIKKAGKRVIIYPENAEEIKIFHKELGPEKIVYQYNFKNLEEAEEIKNYLIRNT